LIYTLISVDLSIPNGHGLPVEIWAKSCNVEVIFGHFSSAPLNMRAYGYQGSVVDVLARLGTVET
jgi:hypothetical protein